MHSCWTARAEAGEKSQYAAPETSCLEGVKAKKGHTLGRVLETQVRDGPEELGFEEEVAETGRVNTDIGALLVLCFGGSGRRLGSVVGGSGGGDGGGKVILLVVCREARDASE